MALDNGKGFGLSPEIAKLSDKLAKDPSSKLFVPLAEEYRKSGMLDEAIQVLTDGLKANPNYMTARVSLGKMFLEKGNIVEAQDEFEKVVNAIPDNLFAHKKLAEIYQSEGDRQKLLKEYKIILTLSPKDEEAKKAIDQLEGKPVLMSSDAAVEQKPESPEPEIEFEIKPEVPLKEEEIEEDIMKVEEEPPIEIAITPEELPQDLRQEMSIESFEEAIGEIPAIGAAVPEVEKAGETVYELPEDDINPEDFGIEIPLKMTPVVEGPVTKEMEMLKASVMETPKEEIATPTMADIYIKQGLYDKADEIYQQILNSDPANKEVLQKREELFFLMSFLKGKEEGVKDKKENMDKYGKLEAWLKNIEERKR